MSTVDVATIRQWVAAGTELMRNAIVSLGNDEAAWDAPSELPGWTRKNLVAHVAANADALVNLTTWASTGVETPMYSSPQQRSQDIADAAFKSPTELRDWFDKSVSALEEGWDGLDEAAWRAPVVTAQGRTVPASETPWMRSREILIHPVDMATGVSFNQLPEGFLTKLIDDTAGKRATQETPALHLVADSGQTWDVAGNGAPVTVTGPLPQLAAWMAGRDYEGLQAEGGVPQLPAWL